MSMWQHHTLPCWCLQPILFSCGFSLFGKDEPSSEEDIYARLLVAAPAWEGSNIQPWRKLVKQACSLCITLASIEILFRSQDVQTWVVSDGHQNGGKLLVFAFGHVLHCLGNQYLYFFVVQRRPLYCWLLFSSTSYHSQLFRWYHRVSNIMSANLLHQESKRIILTKSQGNSPETPKTPPHQLCRFGLNLPFRRLFKRCRPTGQTNPNGISPFSWSCGLPTSTRAGWLPCLDSARGTSLQCHPGPAMTLCLLPSQVPSGNDWKALLIKYQPPPGMIPWGGYMDGAALAVARRFVPGVEGWSWVRESSAHHIGASSRMERKDVWLAVAKAGWEWKWFWYICSAKIGGGNKCKALSALLLFLVVRWFFCVVKQLSWRVSLASYYDHAAFSASIFLFFRLVNQHLLVFECNFT